MPEQRRKIVYACSHEFPDPKYEAPRKPSVFKRIKRALSTIETIRTPSMELCPYCQRLEDESQRRQAAHGSRPATQPRRQISPARQHETRPRRSNTVAAPATVAQPADPFPDFENPSYVPPRNPYRDSNMDAILANYENVKDMEERVRRGLANETAAERQRRLKKIESLHLDWRTMDVQKQLEAMGINPNDSPEHIQPSNQPRPKSLKELFDRSRTAQEPEPMPTSRRPVRRLEPSASGDPEEDSRADAEMAVKREAARRQKIEKAERIRKRAEELMEGRR
ncbi:hypothetical protein SBOR_5874 [Sclerotinia borealis F-4128]|uniref:Uncharacterized protein n=1 Tax=Sclerotinia borealis (strain F-4128) TaxID=1432307 RepID=W9CAE0_SCLBF|nr:hypothetical protein SBOR_5874 [Sclerotinia borealis F-4128]